jgi:RNA polymerase sigma-70 factor (ECF subfamily)
MQIGRAMADGAFATSENDDRQLVAAAAGGSRPALAELYDRHASTLLALGIRILGDRARAEDVLHEVFLEAWHHAHEYDSARGSVRAWLVTRMRSRSLDNRARIVRGRGIAQAAAAEPAHASPTDIAGEADHQRVREVVSELADDLRRVIDLAYFEGLSSSEIAERVGVPIGTVKSRLARAVAALKDRIGPAAATKPGGRA